MRVRTRKNRVGDILMHIDDPVAIAEKGVYENEAQTFICIE